VFKKKRVVMEQQDTANETNQSGGTAMTTEQKTTEAARPTPTETEHECSEPWVTINIWIPNGRSGEGSLLNGSPNDIAAVLRALNQPEGGCDAS